MNLKYSIHFFLLGEVYAISRQLFSVKNESESGSFILFLLPRPFLISELLPVEQWECPQSAESITAHVRLADLTAIRIGKLKCLSPLTPRGRHIY